MTGENLLDCFLDELKAWYAEHTDGKPMPYVICAGLAVLEAMGEKFPLEYADYVTPKAQVRRTGRRIAKIIERFGEERRFVVEGGRTTRGTLAAAQALVKRLNLLDCGPQVASMSSADRQRQLVWPLQRWIVENPLAEYLNSRRLAVEVDLRKPPRRVVADILAVADERKVAGAVAQHLVGAKLELRYPDLSIERRSFTTADRPGGQPGDFLVGDTAIHVTVAPAQPLLEKAEENIRQGYRVKLLVPEGKAKGTELLAENARIADWVDVSPLEQFIGENIEEIAQFGRDDLANGFRALLEKYNDRIAEVESDQSLQIDVPANLGRRTDG